MLFIQILPLVEFTDGTFEPVSAPIYGSNDLWDLNDIGTYSVIRAKVLLSSGAWEDRPVIQQDLGDFKRSFIKSSDYA